MPQMRGPFQYDGDRHAAGEEAVWQCGAIRPQQGDLRRTQSVQGRPIDEESLKHLGQQVEESLRAQGIAQVPSEEIGKAILKPLRELDEVAYLRFASVYQNFEGLEDFQHAIDKLRVEDRA